MGQATSQAALVKSARLGLIGHLRDDELEKKIQYLRDNALKKIDDYAKKHGQGSVINNEGIELFLQEIKNKMILVAVVGEGSSGKSTLINAFLRDKLLPSAVGKVTGVRVFIGHNPIVHKGPCDALNGSCDKCPYLVRGFGSQQALCHGVQNIEKRLRQENTMQGYQEPLVLYTYIPVFASLTSNQFTPYLVDSPGVEKIKKDVHSYYSILSAMIYVENYPRLLHNEENIKEELALMPKEASLFFAVSKFDSYFTSSSSEKNPDEEGTKDIVTQSLSNITRDSIFPVCGLWALNAHLALKYKNDDEEASRGVNLAYAGCAKNDSNIDLDGKATYVLDVIAFARLEEKLTESVRATDLCQWNVNVHNQCQKLLKDPIEVGKTIIDELETQINRMKETIMELNSKSEVLKTLEDHLQDYMLKDRLEQSLQKKSANFIKMKLSPKIEEELNTFCSICKGNVNQNYKFGQFMKDFEIFKKGTLSEAVIKVANDEAIEYVRVLQIELEKLYITLITHIENGSRSLEACQVDSDRLDDYSFGKPSERMKNFINGKTYTERVKNFVYGAVSGTSLFAPGVVFALGKSILSYTFAVSLGGPFVGISLAAYFIYKAWNTTDAEMILNEEDIEKLCKDAALDIERDHAEIKKKLEDAVLSTIRNYDRSLWREYNEKWKWNFIAQLKEAEKSLESLRSEQDEFKKALKELEDCNLFLEKLLEKTETD